MAVYLSLTAVVILTAMLIKKTEFNTGYAHNMCIHRGMKRQDMVNIIAMLIIFTGLFLVSALRVNVGNDYATYVEKMHLVYSGAYVITEPGFNILTYIIYYLCGSEQFIILFAFFAFFTVLFFMKAIWDQSEWFLLSFAMFMLLGYYFQSISTVRYYLALGMALYSMKFVIKKDWPRFVIVALAGALFHYSILLILVFYPLARMKWKRWMYGAGAVLCLSCLFLNDLYLKLALWIYYTYRNTELNTGTSLTAIARCVAVLAFAIWVLRDKLKENRTYLFYFQCNVMGLAIYIFGKFLPEISRIAYDLTVTQILFIPALIKNIKDDKKRKIFTVVVCGACLLYFAMYMKYDAPRNGVRILPYQTILFHDMPPILSDKGY